jgi:aminoglycoside phosphotransferase (APT) family kinase protein
VRSPQGRLIETMHGQNWRVHEWMEVGPSPVTPTPAAVARRIGAIFGTLHSLAIPHEAPMGEHLTLRRPDAEWEQLLDRARAAHKPWAEQLDETLPMLFDLRTIEADIGSNEFILCNRVLNPEHVRIGHNDELVVTKWNFAGSLTPEFELGWALTQWTLEPSINARRSRRSATVTSTLPAGGRNSTWRLSPRPFPKPCVAGSNPAGGTLL